MALPEGAIESLPNELLIAILAPLETTALVPLSLISRRFQSLVARILHHRLLLAAALPRHELILECYHPSERISTPYLECRYLGTDVLAPSCPSRSDAPVQGGEPHMRGMSRFYTRFRPVVTEENRRPRLRYPRLSDAASSATAAAEAVEPVEEAGKQEIHLDESELFSQLCTVTNLVKVGPKRGFFLSHVNLTDSVLRVWRPWLADAAAGVLPDTEGGDILWADKMRTVGLRFEVRPSGTERMPLLVGEGEDPPVSYTLIYKELLVRTTKLLLAVEKADVDEVANSGNTFIIDMEGTKACRVNDVLWLNQLENPVRPDGTPVLLVA